LRGGFSTKVTAVACDEDDVIAVDVVGSQRNEAPLAGPVPAEAAEALRGFDEIPGDKGVDSDAILVAVLEGHNATPVIPNRADRAVPWPWDDEMREWFKQRNRIEQASGKAKQSRRFATRYQKLDEMYLAVMRLDFGFIGVRRLARTVKTP
jgi:hypothetical protein